MLMKDLLEQLMQLNEAPVKPGERKGISFKLKKLEKISDKLRQYQNSMSHMKMAQLPGELQKEMQQLQDKLNDEIDKVDKAYQVEFEKSKVNGRPVKMNNLFNALAKNCKEIIKVYKELNRNDFSRGKFLYRGIRSSDEALMITICVVLPRLHCFSLVRIAATFSPKQHADERLRSLPTPAVQQLLQMGQRISERRVKMHDFIKSLGPIFSSLARDNSR
jgi:hypothetical protein